MKISFKTFLAAACMVLSGGSASAGLLFSAWLDGHQEGLDSIPGKGVIGIKLNEAMDSALVFGAFTNLSGPITAAHFHPGQRGVNNPPSMPINDWIQGNSLSATWTGIAKSTVDSLMRGFFYVNVHTAAHPAGEIRGQVELERDLQFTAEIKGANESTPVTTAADGMGFFQLSPDDSILTAWVVYRQPAQTENDSVTLAHLHIGPPGADGKVALDLVPHLDNGAIMAAKPVSAPLNGITAAAFLDSLKKGSVYINFHSAAHPGGLMRGQLAVSQERIFAAKLAGGASGIGGKGLGLFSLSPDNAALTVKTAYSKLTGPVTGANLHRGLPIALPIDSTGGSPLGLSETVVFASKGPADFSVGDFLADLAMGRIAINLNTAGYPNGEVFGTLKLLARQGSAFRLDGSQETPAVATKAFGAGVVSMDMDSTNVRYLIVADSLDSAFTASHFHRGAAGAAGGVVFDIGKSFAMNADSMTGLHATGVWSVRNKPNAFDKSMAAALLHDSLYVNIHSARNKGGAIRGQVADRAQAGTPILGRSARPGRGGSHLVAAPGGRGLRFRGIPGQSVNLRILDLKGRSRAGARLILNSSGLSQPLDLGGLKPGMYVAAWQEKGGRFSARFLLP